MSEEPTETAKEPVTVDNDEAAHFLKVMDYADENIARLTEELNEFKKQKKEAEDEFFADVPSDWSYIRVNGRVTHTRISKPGPERLYIEDLRAKYPEIEEELKRSKPTEKVTRVKS